MSGLNLGRHWEFRKDEVDEWVRSRIADEGIVEWHPVEEWCAILILSLAATKG